MRDTSVADRSSRSTVNHGIQDRAWSNVFSCTKHIVFMGQRPSWLGFAHTFLLFWNCLHMESFYMERAMVGCAFLLFGGWVHGRSASASATVEEWN
jgi:hypothetical protein